MARRRRKKFGDRLRKRDEGKYFKERGGQQDQDIEAKEEQDEEERGETNWKDERKKRMRESIV